MVKNKRAIASTSSSISSKKEDIQDLFITYGDKTNTDKVKFETAMRSLSKSDDNYVERASAGYYRSFVDIAPNITVRSPFTREDYSFFRPTERVPRKQKEIIAYCMTAYEKVGIVHNVIDLMSDFTCRGIKPVHPDPKFQKRFDKWWKKVRGEDRSERFANLLYRAGNVIVKRNTGKLTNEQQKKFNFSVASDKAKAADMKVGPDQKLLPGELPIKYTFLNPLLVDMIEPELSIFVGQPLYGITLSPTILRKIRNPTSALERSIVNKLPKDIVNATAHHDVKILPLHPNNISVYHYKKDDWLVWSNPLTYCILDDLIQLEKAKLADLAALDGIISNVRLWKLGSLEHKILPTQHAISKLATILSSNTGGGSFDLIWGPEIELIESKADFAKFLNSEKYVSIMNQIYMGLGIPPTLTGSSIPGGFTNNFISLKTLVDRLEYGRSILKDFWNKELALVAKQFGCEPPHLHFDKITMSDESAEKALLIQLVDRGLMSIETVIERFGEIPEIEKIRMDREEKERKDGILGPKSGPYHNNQLYNDLLKIFAQQGAVTPSECGLELEENDEGQTTVIDQKADLERELTNKQLKMRQQTNQINNLSSSKPKGRPGQGRPKNKKDSGKRKQKTVKPRSRVKAGHYYADFLTKCNWANIAQKAISDYLNPPLLDFFNKKDLRSLTNEEAAKCENIKFGVLSQLEPYQEVNKQIIMDLFKRNAVAVNKKAAYIKNQLLTETIKKTGKEPSLEVIRQAQVMAYALIND